MMLLSTISFTGLLTQVFWIKQKKNLNAATTPPHGACFLAMLVASADGPEPDKFIVSFQRRK